METKFDLHLCANYQNERLKSAIVNCVLTDYLIEKLRVTIRKYNNEDIDLFHIYEYFKNVIEKGNRIDFAGIDGWEHNKMVVFQDCFGIVIMLDDIVAKSGLIEVGSIVEEFRRDCEEYSVLLGLCDITCQHVDFGSVEVRQDYIDNLKNQLLLVDEGQFLTDLTGMRKEILPLDTLMFRHKHIEQRLQRAQNVASSIAGALEKEFNKLHKDIVACYNKFYKVAYSSLSDAEKVEMSRKICKVIVPHRKALDRFENKLTIANEIKRQLMINEKKLKEDLESRMQEFDAKMKERPYEKDEIERQRQSFLFVTDEYFDKIEKTIQLVNKVAQDISNRYNIIDKVEVSLNAGIPGESELKRYSALTFKYEDLYVRLNLANAQIVNKDEDFETALKAAMAGLKCLSDLAKKGKDVFVRNSLLSMVFNCVNSMYDLVDTKNKSLELTQVKFVTSRLVKYSLQNNNFNNDLRTFRHINNNSVRDIAIMMGKPFSLQNMFDIVESIELSINQVEDILKTINDNHTQQSELLSEILNVN